MFPKFFWPPTGFVPQWKNGFLKRSTFFLPEPIWLFLPPEKDLPGRNSRNYKPLDNYETSLLNDIRFHNFQFGAVCYLNISFLVTIQAQIGKLIYHFYFVH